MDMEMDFWHLIETYHSIVFLFVRIMVHGNPFVKILQVTNSIIPIVILSKKLTNITIIVEY